MPAVWFSVKRSIQCKAEPRNVHDPTAGGGGGGNKSLRRIVTKKARENRSGCSKSIANLKDVVIHGSKRHTEKPPVCSPRSIGSSELLNPITHEVVLSSSTCELKISTGYGFREGSDGAGGDVSDFVGILKPGTPGPARLHHGKGHKPGGGMGSPVRRASSSLSRRSSGVGHVVARPRSSFGADFQLVCHKCGEHFVKWEAVEEHHLSAHAVTELVEGDSSRKIVEIICRGNCKPENNPSDVERILKVHNMQKTIAEFEEYRELVKIKANKLPKKHPRCMADGNELLRFHGATVECSLGKAGSSALCSSDKCMVCEILRHGFSSRKELTTLLGVFTTSTSSRAFESVHVADETRSVKRALIMCRVIAGRVHRPLENAEEFAGQSGYDSVAGKVGIHSNVEELYLLNPRALLPCFVVIYKL